MSKRIYLDQNKWIDIARAFYGRNDGKKFIDVMNLLKKLSDNESIVIPISLTHYIETTRPENEERRKRLSKFIVDLSKCNSILPFHSVREFEIKNSVLQKLGLKSEYDIHKIAIGKGLLYASGGKLELPKDYERLDNLVHDIANSPETTYHLLVNSIDREMANEFKKEDMDMLDEYEKIRKENFSKYTEEECESIAIYGMVTERILPTLVPYVKEKGSTIEKFCDLFNDNRNDWVEFFNSMPTLDIWINLNHERDKDSNRLVDRNDLNDIAFLTMAIPYCDIVVAEKYWIKMLKRLGYDKKYNTLLFTDINDLIDELE